MNPTSIDQHRHVDRTGVAMTALSAMFFGTLAIFGKSADRQGIPLMELLAIRFAGAAVILWTVAVVRRQRLWWGRQTAGPILMGGLYIAQAVTYFSSLRTLPAAVTSILLYLYPVIVTILAALLLREGVDRRRLGALALAVTGVFLVVDPLQAHTGLDRSGVLLGLATAAIYATYILAGRALLRGVPAVVATAYIATIAAALAALTGEAAGQLRPLDGGGYRLALAMAVVATAIPAALLLAGLARVGATQAAIISTLEPAATVLLAGLLLGERLGPMQLLGGAVVLTGAVLIASAKRADLASPPVRE